MIGKGTRAACRHQYIDQHAWIDSEIKKRKRLMGVRNILLLLHREQVLWSCGELLIPLDYFVHRF